MKTRFKFYIGFLALLLAALAPGAVDIVLTDWTPRTDGKFSKEALGHYAYFKRHLQQPFRGYASRQTLLDGFCIVALSHLACGLANVTRLDPSRASEARILLQEVVRRALSPHVAPLPRFVERPQYWKKKIFT